MIVEVDPTSPVPAYEQLRRQVASMVAAGTLVEDERLPPIRRLAADLGLAPGTVARAYRELEAAGMVRAAGRRGTRVAPAISWRASAPAADALAEAARRYALTVSQLGANAEAAIEAVDQAMEQLGPAS